MLMPLQFTEQASHQSIKHTSLLFINQLISATKEDNHQVLVRVQATHQQVQDRVLTMALLSVLLTQETKEQALFIKQSALLKVLATVPQAMA
jgi:hypothetical protein